MDDLSYSKFKDVSPADTIYRIRSIFHRLGIMTIDQWIESGIEGCYSLQVTIAGTGMSANGKGTDPTYALASAYAELMERMQSGILYNGDYSDEAMIHAGFLKAPDEKYVSYDEAADMENAMMHNVLSCTVLKETAGDIWSEDAKEARLQAVKNWTTINPPGNPFSVVTIPFYSLKNRRVEYLLYDMYAYIYGSNGMCAGNTPEEALVQGLAEVFERYVNKKLIEDRITPPTIPDEYLMHYPGLFKMIQDIEAGGRYKMIVKDYSLGKKYPVVGTLLIDTFRGTFGMKLGSHPLFQIALERTLTEAFQGRRIQEVSQISRISFDSEFLDHRYNVTNIAKVAIGYYPAQLLMDTFSYEFEPFMDSKDKQNTEMLQDMVRLLMERGYDLLVRDVSFLGFPSYQILVPGFSDMFLVDKLRARERKTHAAIRESLANLGSASAQELERIVRYIKYKKNSLLDNQMNFIIGRPLKKAFPGGIADVQFLLAVCLYKLGRLDEAALEMRNVYSVQSNAGDDEMGYYNCMADYMKAKSAGLGLNEIHTFLQALYQDNIVQSVVCQLDESEKVFDRIYPRFNCWGCENCDAREYCCYRETENVLKRLKECYAANPIDQERLAAIF